MLRMSDSLKRDKLHLGWCDDHGPVYQEDTKEHFWTNIKHERSNESQNTLLCVLKSASSKSARPFTWFPGDSLKTQGARLCLPGLVYTYTCCQTALSCHQWVVEVVQDHLISVRDIQRHNVKLKFFFNEQTGKNISCFYCITSMQ